MTVPLELTNFRIAIATPIATVIALIALLAWAPSAAGHAQLLESEPQTGSRSAESPERVTFGFDEPVEASFGAVRVYDSAGEQVDTGELLRPDGDEALVAVTLPPELPEGTYTATFRVISEDSHPVSGGSVFTVGEPAEPTVSLAELLAADETGTVTEVGAGVARALGYAGMAVAIGGLIFLLAVWLPVGGSPPPRMRSVAAGGAVLVAIAAVLGIVFQGAIASGSSFWGALDSGVVSNVLDTRYGETAGLRGIAALVLTVALAILIGRPESSAASSANLAGNAVPARRSATGTAAVAIAAVAITAIVVTPGIGGHAGSTSPTALMIPLSALHVLAMSAWLGGLAALLFLAPGATRGLSDREKSRILAAAVGRFSLLAMACVGAILATGVAQSAVHLDVVNDLWDTGYGRAILVKGVLLLGLIGLGAFNRYRVAPRLQAAAGADSGPGQAGRALRSALRVEVGLAVAVLGVSATLVALAPPSTSGQFHQDSVTNGPVRAEVTFEPLEVGSQEAHVYLFDSETGDLLDALLDLTVDATEAEMDLGPIPIPLQRAGPGHYLAAGELIAVPGTWEIAVRARVSEFDTRTLRTEVQIR